MRQIFGFLLLILALGLSTVPASTQQPCTATLRSYGAVGDGRHDDAASIQSALAKECALDGEGLSYNVTKSLRIQSNTSLSNTNIIQNIPPSGLLRPIFGRGIKNIVLSKVAVYRGSDPYSGRINEAAGIWLDHVENLKMIDVEVSGDGNGAGIFISYAKNVVLTRPYVHDMRWAVHGRQPCNEQMEGIRVTNAQNVMIDGARVGNLTPETIVMSVEGARECSNGPQPTKRRAGEVNNMTDGIDPTNSANFTISNAEIWGVGEGIDSSGSDGMHALIITKTYIHDVKSTCFKISGNQGPLIIIRDSRGTRCGLYSYMISGDIKDVILDNNISEDLDESNNSRPIKVDFFVVRTSMKKAEPNGLVLRKNNIKLTKKINIRSLYYFLKLGPTDRMDSIVFQNNTINGYPYDYASCDLRAVATDKIEPLRWCRPTR